MANQDSTFSFLFGNYFLAFSGFMKSFRQFHNNTGADEELRVMMGAPEAAFRSEVLGENNNGMPRLPVLNFLSTDFKRIQAMENPFVRISMKTSPYAQTINGIPHTPVTMMPQKWDLTFQCQLWTAGEIERDDLVSKILTMFHGGQVSVPWFPDEMANPGMVVWITFKMEEGFTDATEYEGLPEKSARDFIRTDFTITTQAMLPYTTVLIPAIKSIQVNKNIKTLSNGFYRLDVVSPVGADPLQTTINQISL